MSTGTLNQPMIPLRSGFDQAADDSHQRTGAREALLAKQVQLMLLPQNWPQRGGVECFGLYRPADVVGGDYFDFLECSKGGTVMLVADVSGHGLAAALLMANLQACFRSREKCAFESLGKLVQSVNESFHRCSLPTFYATLFIGYFDPIRTRLSYVNCAHSPPLLIRAGGACEWLGSTAQPVGMFPRLHCTVEQVAFSAGDSLVAYTDGITEAENNQGEPFGESRLEATASATRELPVSKLAGAVLAHCLRFSGESQDDDMTIVIARGKTH